MKQKLKKMGYWASVITLGLIVGISLQLARANWTAPVSPAPNGNVGAPINTGTVPQNKAGSLGVGGSLGVSGAINAGAAVPGLVAGDVKGTRLCIGSECRSSWPDGGGSTGALYGMCSQLGSRNGSIMEGNCGRYQVLVAPAIKGNDGNQQFSGSCSCPAGYTKVNTGSATCSTTYPGHDVSVGYFSCAK